MSVYNFTCKKCQSEWEAIVGPINDPDSKRCPECKSTKIVRNFSGSLADVVYTKHLSDSERKSAIGIRDYYERPDVKEKLKTGEIQIQEAGPREFRPRMDKRLY